MAQENFHRCNRFSFAGDDQIKIAEIGVDVECKPVGCHPTSEMYPDCRHLPLRRMYAGKALNAKSLDSEICHCADQDFFQITHIPVNVFTFRTETDNGITNYLAQAMISY